MKIRHNFSQYGSSVEAIPFFKDVWYSKGQKMSNFIFDVGSQQLLVQLPQNIFKVCAGFVVSFRLTFSVPEKLGIFTYVYSKLTDVNLGDDDQNIVPEGGAINFCLQK